jgi:16S rRNA (adenine1518-N6/adenine1519-N6)-dimethyltransferase
MNLTQETKFIMKKYNITANKNYGQNFLIDENIVNSIVESANISKNDIVIEIGPGLGTLTSALLDKAGKVVCIELDKKMLDILQDRFALYNNFELINEDVLKVDLHSLIDANLHNFKSAKVVANLPYYITTPIIMKLLENKLQLESITVMVQKEVAERLTEVPGGKNSGAITYSINYYTKPTLVTNVPNTSFIPSPKVDSSVIHLQLLSTPKVSPLDEELFFKIIKTAFLQKRKTLINTLLIGKFGDRAFLEEMLTSLNIDLKIRGEKLTLEQFQEISDYISNNLNI